MSFYPSYQELCQRNNQEKVLEVKTSFRAILPIIFMFFGSFIGVYFLCYLDEMSQFRQSLPFLKHLSPRWLGIIPAIFLIETFRRRYDDLYLFSNNTVQHYNGRLSLKYTVPSVKYSDIKNLIVDQTIWGRILDYGDVELGTAAQADVEMILTGVRSPVELANLIEEMRANYERDFD